MYFLPLHPAVLLKGVSHARLPPMWLAGSNPGIDAICGLRLLLVFSLAPRRFSPGTSIRFPLSSKTNTFNSSSIWNAPTRFHEFLRNPKCSLEAGDLCYKKDQSNCVIHWKQNYPVDSAIHRLSNCCLVFFKMLYIFVEETTGCRFTIHFFSVCKRT